MWKDTHSGLHSGGSFKHVHGAFLLGLPRRMVSIILICLVQSPYLVYHRILPCMPTLLLAKMNSPEEA